MTLLEALTLETCLDAPDLPKPSALPLIDSSGGANALIRLGFQLVRLKPGTKEPISGKGWQNSCPSPSDFVQGEGIGVQLGSKSDNIVDIDLDCDEARQLAHLLLPKAVGFRRESLPPSAPGHLLYRCPDIPEKHQTVTKFGFTGKHEEEAAKRLGLPKSVVLEIRAGKAYTAFPPSAVPIEDTEGRAVGYDRLVWNDDAPPTGIPEVLWDGLRKRAGMLAFLAIALRVYPREQGGRDDFCHKFAGALLEAGFDAEEADRVIGQLAHLADDTELSMRRGKAQRIANRLEEGDSAPTLHSFLTHVGLADCEKRIRDWIGLEKRQSRRAEIPDDAIDVDSHELHLKVGRLGEHLRDHSGEVYKRGGKLVRIFTLESPEHVVRDVNGREEVIRSRPAGLFEIRDATPGWLSIEASRSGLKFWKRTRLVEPPIELFNKLRDYTDSLDLPALRGISMTPTLYRNQPGYDREQGIYHAYPEHLFPPGPSNPTRSDAEEALARLLRPIRAFPFLDDSARAVAVSGIISGVLRADLSGIPIHLFDAPSAGTGKTLISKVIGIVATGVLPTILTYTGDEEEDRKQLSVALMAGSPVILFDNISKPLRGDFIAGVATSPEFDVRLLGKSENVKIDTRSLLLGSGNNTVVQGDLGRRTIRCRLDAGVERPEEREFNFDALAEARDTRTSLVVDALTIVRTYLRADRPSPLTPLGSFEEWSRLVREPLVWLGLGDPAGTRSAFEDFDPERETKMKLVQALFRAFGANRWFKIAEIEDTVTVGASSVKDDLAALLYNNHWSTRGLGKLLSKHRDGPLLGIAIRTRMDRHAGVMEYCLEGDPTPELLSAASSGPAISSDDGIPF